MKNKKLLMGIVGVLLLAACAGVYVLLFVSDSADAAEEAPPEPAAIVKLDPFLTNIADQRRARVEVALAIAPIDRSAEVQADPLLLARLRDRVLTMLASRTYEELTSASGKESFRAKIREAAQEIIAEGEVQEALFVDFVVQ